MLKAQNGFLKLCQTSAPTYPQDHMRSLTGARSVPRVFIGGKCVGGGDEVASLDAKGKLKPMLEEVGAL